MIHRVYVHRSLLHLDLQYQDPKKSRNSQSDQAVCQYLNPPCVLCYSGDVDQWDKCSGAACKADTLTEGMYQRSANLGTEGNGMQTCRRLLRSLWPEHTPAQSGCIILPADAVARP